MIISPFDHEQKLANYKRTLSLNTFNNLLPQISSTKESSLYSFHLKESEAQDLISYDESSSCKKPIKVKACFGDCVWQFEGKKEWTETLSTPDYLGSDSFSICADNYLDQLSQKNWSKSVKQTLCEQFVFEVVRKSHGPGESCAALRFEVDCSQL